MLKKILVGLVIIIVAFLCVVSMQRPEFQVVRSATISAPPAVVFPLVNDFHNWEKWSPWGKLDPAMKQTYEGAPSGTGAIYTWSGNSQVGEGRMTLAESRLHEKVRINLEFIRPFKAVNLTEFAFKPDGSQTVVTWSMLGTNNFMSKAVCMFMNMDKTLGGDFEKGLAQMKTVAESTPKTAPSGTEEKPAALPTKE